MQNPSSTDFGVLETFFARKVLKDAYTEEWALFLKTLMQKTRQGDLCLIPKGLLAEAAETLPAAIVCEGVETHPSTPVVRQNGRYYLQRSWVYESLILDQVQRLRALPPPSFYDKNLFEIGLQKTLVEKKILPDQGKAIQSIFENTFTLICGGPGTGKTYTAGWAVRLLIASLKGKSYKLYLAAATGKAASHLRGALGDAIDPILKVESTTLHRLLRLQPGENRLFSGRKIDADLVIVDEASMLDVPLLAHLISAIGNQTKLVLMGDPDQLPPIEAGSLFAEMASIFGISLQKSLRTEDAVLQRLAEVVNGGEVDEALSLITMGRESEFKKRILESIDFKFFWEQPDPKTALAELNRFRILGALRQGPLGTDALNREIVDEIARRIQPGQWWVIPILITSNEPRLDLYNGTCGVMIGKSRGFRDGVAYFPGREPIRSLSLPPFEPSFCLSVHKSQGSEFEQVLALFPQGSENFGREALYTGITRAKKKIEILIEEEVLRKMLVHRSRRTSGFAERYRNLRSSIS